MIVPRSVDDIYGVFVRMLPPPLADFALDLPVTLRLVPASTPWSQIFSDEPRLSAPSLVAEAMSGLPQAMIDDAALAHVLAVIDAISTSRIFDGHVQGGPELDAVLSHARRVRDAAIARVAPDLRGGLNYERAEEEMVGAIRAQQTILRNGEAVPWARYIAIAGAKHCLTLPASLALACAAGWDDRRRRAIVHLLGAINLALQLYDDVIDWEENLILGGAWAAAIAAHSPLRVDPRDRKTMPVSARRLVLQSGALLRMLAHSARSFRAVRRLATALSAARLAAWAAGREAHVGALVRVEATSPGQTNRSYALSLLLKLPLVR